MLKTERKIIKYQDGGNSNNLFKQFMAMMGGGSGLNSGLFNFDFTSKKNPEAGPTLNNAINGSLNGLATAGLQYYQNSSPNDSREDKTINQADAVSSTALSTLAKAPGIIGQVGQGLNLINEIGGGIRKKNYEKKLGAESQILNQTSGVSGLASLQSDIRSDSNVGNTLIGSLFGNKKRNANISGMAQLRKKGQQVSGLVNYNTRKKQDALSSGDVLNQQNYLGQSGFNYDDVQFGRKGMKVEKEKDLQITKYKSPVNSPKILRDKSINDGRSVMQKMNQIYETQRDLRKQIKEVEKLVQKKVEMKKEGGPINVIVEGPLHAHKHDLKSLQIFKDVDMTHKGVPVIMEEGGEINQVQEVEGDELILHLELTKKMEELMKDGSEEAMIEAGKILSKEIVRNTKDSKSKLLKND